MTGAATTTAATTTIESHVAPQAPTSKPPARRLELFRRQLAAAFGPAERRRSGLRASLKFHTSEPQDGEQLPSREQTDGFRARSLESRHEPAAVRVSPVHTRRLLRTAPTRLFCSTTTTTSARKARAPRHLIRMFAERREDSLLEQTRQGAAGCQNIVGHLFDAATSYSASKFGAAAKTLDSATIDSGAPISRFAKMTPKLSLPVDHEWHTRTTSAQPPSVSPGKATGASSSSDQLMRILDELEREWGAATSSKVNREFCADSELLHERTRQVARNWPDECHHLRLQQEAILELLSTELNYIQRLGVVSDLFLDTLEQVKARSQGQFLADIEPAQLVSNFTQILDAHRALWLRHFRSLITECQLEDEDNLLKPAELSGAFVNVCRALAPYYCFCTEQESCIGRIKSLCATSDSFRAYLGWCESRPECARMRLVDLLALPMQRLTRYPLLLRTILKRTDTPAVAARSGNQQQQQQQQQCEALIRMIALTDKFVHTVDLEMKRRDDFNKLCDISERFCVHGAHGDATSTTPISTCNHDPGFAYYNQEVQTILRSYLANFNSQHLMLSLFECPSACHRQLIFDSSASALAPTIKFKDASQSASRLDVIILIFTDQLLVCKQVTAQQRPSRWHRSATRSKLHHSQRKLQSHYASSSANSDQLQVPSSFEQPAATATPRPLFMRQRAASHSFERKQQQQQLQKNTPNDDDDDLNFLSPARALIKMSSEQTLDVWATAPSPSATPRRLSMSNCATPSARPSNHQTRSVSICSLASNSNHLLSWPASGFSASELINPLATPPVSPQSRHLRRQSQSLSGHLKLERWRAESCATKLRLVQSPYPIERLIAHELADRRSVLICLLNGDADVQTVVNSFVLIFPKQSSGRMSPAKKLSAALDEARMRHSVLGQLHGRQPTKQLRAAALAKPHQPSRGSSIESTSPARNCNSQQADNGESLRFAQLVAEQHELFMLSHGRREELATNEFTYELARGPGCASNFRVITRSLAATTTCSPSHSTRSQWPPAPLSVSPTRQRLRSSRPQLGRSTRVLNDQQQQQQQPDGWLRSANSASPSLESDGDTTSRFDNLLAFGRSNDSERDVGSICSQSTSMAATGVSRQASQRTSASSRRNLSSLRRQNVVLSVSCEQQQQQQPELSRVVNQDSLDRRLLHTQFAHNRPQHLVSTRMHIDSFSLDSTAGGNGSATSTPRTGNSLRRGSRKNFLSRRYESSSVQTTTTIDQTFDESTTIDLAAEQEDELSRLLAVRGREAQSQNLTRLQSIRSVSTDQTSSPIAVTLTVPSWCDTMVEPMGQEEEPFVEPTVPYEPVVVQRRQSDHGNHTDEMKSEGLLTGCLDIRSLKIRDKQRGPTRSSSPRPSDCLKRHPRKQDAICSSRTMDGQFVSCVPTQIRVEQMKLIRNLIEVKIPESELNKANFEEGLSIEVKSERPFIVNAFWIVKINEVHQEIERDWKSLHDALVNGTFLTKKQCSLYQNSPEIYHETRKEVQCKIKPPKKIDTSSMTQKPRDFYPLVIIVTCHDDDNLSALEPATGSEAAANIHIVHIQDSIVPIKSHVMKQYIKQMDGRILDISQLYQEDTAACFICFEEADPAEKITLFCLLPCRHMPICSNCILRIRECPKCRCPIASVFDINAPSVEAPQSDADRPTIDPSLRHLYDDASDNGTGTPRRHNGQHKSGFLSGLKSMFGL